MTVAVEIPCVERLHHETYEVGPVTSEGLLNLLIASPGIKDTGFFRLDLLAAQGAIPNSSADLVINIDENERSLDIRNTQLVHPAYNYELGSILSGGKLEKLSLRYPNYHGDAEDFGLAGDAFEVLRENLEVFENAGYSLHIPSFKLFHYMVKVPDAHPGFFSSSYESKIALKTLGLIEGKPERKLVLEFTPDLESSDEVRAYREILDSIDASND